MGRRVLMAFLLAVVGHLAFAGGATLQMWDGRPVLIQGAGRPVLIETPGGGYRPLLDGVHRLQDGSTVTVRRGVLQSQALLEPSRSALRAQQTLALARCRVLVDKVCGRDGACADAQACRAARQLMDLETEEREVVGTSSVTPSGHMCNEALLDEEFFVPCPAGDSAGP
jgi:hypothetical protein